MIQLATALNRAAVTCTTNHKERHMTEEQIKELELESKGYSCAIEYIVRDINSYSPAAQAAARRQIKILVEWKAAVDHEIYKAKHIA